MAAATLMLVVPAKNACADHSPRFVPGRLVVKLRQETGEGALAAALQPYGAHTRRPRQHSRIRLVQLAERDAEHALAILRNHRAIEFAERDYLAAPAGIPSDPDVASGLAWHLAKTQTPAAWDVTSGVSNIVVAVLDSGAQFTHPDLSGRLIPGFDFINDDADASDDFGHGTAVAGVIVASGNNNLGGAGVAFGCVVLPVKVCGADGAAPYSAIADGIRYAADHGARVINISLVGDQPSATLQDAVNYAWTRNVVVVAATGNTADATPQYPAACPNVVAVSASALNDGLCPFSSYGPHIAVAAPGDSIWTTQVRADAAFGAWSGTSLASPIAAGTVALAASVNSSLSNTQLVSILTGTADDVGAIGNDSLFGAGRVNAARAVAAALNTGAVASPPHILTPPANQSVEEGGLVEFFVEASGEAPLTYQWQFNGVDLPGATNSTFSIASAQETDAGAYTVVVSNAVGVVVSLPATLSLKPVVNLPPVVTVANPLTGARVRLGTTVTLAANATDSDDVVLGVTFLSGGVALGAATNAAASASTKGVLTPFSVNWRPSSTGLYSIAAVALDAGGLSSTSAPVMLQVLPPDTNRPTVKLLTAPSDKTRLTTPTVVLGGTAGDDAQLDRVEISLNNGPFVPATGASNWSARITLAAGANTLRIRSVDAAGNTSLELKRTVTLVVNLPITILTKGVGTVSLLRNGQLLELGKAYKVTAVPGADQVFAGWTGIVSDKATLSFTMQSNLVLEANFIPNPFLPVKGSYAGLFWNTNGVSPADSGQFTLTLSGSGSFSGKLLLGGRTFPFNGGFNYYGTTTVSVARSGLTPLRLALALDLRTRTDLILGTLADANWIAAVQANRNVWTSASPAPQAGTRLFKLLTAGETPQTTATGSAQISGSGSVKVSGKMVDGRQFSTSATLSKNGDFPFQVLFNGGTETLLGWMNFPPSATNNVGNGNIVWTRTGTNSFSISLQAVPGS